MSDKIFLYESRDGRFWPTQQEARIQNRIITLNEKLHNIAADRAVAENLAMEKELKRREEESDEDVLNP